jgi:hypothetical protein
MEIQKSNECGFLPDRSEYIPTPHKETGTGLSPASICWNSALLWSIAIEIEISRPDSLEINQRTENQQQYLIHLAIFRAQRSPEQVERGFQLDPRLTGKIRKTKAMDADCRRKRNLRMTGATSNAFTLNQETVLLELKP